MYFPTLSVNRGQFLRESGLDGFDHYFVVNHFCWTFHAAFDCHTAAVNKNTIFILRLSDCGLG